MNHVTYPLKIYLHQKLVHARDVFSFGYFHGGYVKLYVIISLETAEPFFFACLAFTV